MTFYTISCVLTIVKYVLFFLRVGHKGIMDLKYITPAAAGSYFTSHLPVLGKLYFVTKEIRRLIFLERIFYLITPGNTLKIKVSVKYLFRWPIF